MNPLRDWAKIQNNPLRRTCLAIVTPVALPVLLVVSLYEVAVGVAEDLGRLARAVVDRWRYPLAEDKL